MKFMLTIVSGTVVEDTAVGDVHVNANRVTTALTMNMKGTGESILRAGKHCNVEASEWDNNQSDKMVVYIRHSDNGHSVLYNPALGRRHTTLFSLLSMCLFVKFPFKVSCVT